MRDGPRNACVLEGCVRLPAFQHRRRQHIRSPTRLTHIDAVLEQGELANYYLAHSARADMCRRLGRTAEARASYEKALALTQQEPERQFLQERIRRLK